MSGIPEKYRKNDSTLGSIGPAITCVSAYVNACVYMSGTPEKHWKNDSTLGLIGVQAQMCMYDMAHVCVQVALLKTMENETGLFR
jgi:hypothetical protein